MGIIAQTKTHDVPNLPILFVKKNANVSMHNYVSSKHLEMIS